MGDTTVRPRAAGGSGMVIGTEYEPEKARAAREHFDELALAREVRF